jgi:hypothetical protein
MEVFEELISEVILLGERGKGRQGGLDESHNACVNKN